MLEIKNEMEFIQVVNSLDFRNAKTYAKTNPHEYCFCKPDETEKLEKVRALNKYLQEHGEKEMFYTTEFDVIFIDGHKYWSMDYWANTSVLNRNWDFKNEDGTINKSKTQAKISE